MQIAVIEFERHVLMYEDENSIENSSENISPRGPLDE
jgi:CTP synthase (UTP-ammonia lyase)